MKYLRSIFLVIVMLFTLSSVSAADKAEGGINIKEILFGHVQDSYSWHVTDVGGKPVIISLPMIFYSQHSGFHVYCSSAFDREPNAQHLRKGPDGFSIQGEAGEKGQIVEQVNGTLEPVSIDISITKTVTVLFIDAFLLVLCILIPARWCKKHKPSDPAPKGFTGFIHMFVMSVYDDMIKMP